MCSNISFLKWGNVFPINGRRRMKVVYEEECLNISAVRLQLGCQGHSWVFWNSSELMLIGANFKCEQYCQILVELNARLWWIGAYLELPLLNHDKARTQHLWKQIERFDDFNLPSWMTHRKILSWGLLLFITSDDGIGVEMRFCRRGAQFYHGGLWNKWNVGGTV